MLKHCLQMVRLVWLSVLRTVTPKSRWALSVFSRRVERVGVGGCSGWDWAPRRCVPHHQLWLGESLFLRLCLRLASPV